MPNPTTKPDEHAVPVYLLLACATPAFAGLMMSDAKGLSPLAPARGSYEREK